MLSLMNLKYIWEVLHFGVWEAIHFVILGGGLFLFSFFFLIINEKKSICKIVDFAVPADHRIKLK